jgi:4-carboxymuconolactone decarboxylase
MTREQLRRQGEETRTSLFGSTDSEPAGFGTLLTEAVLGGVWNRPGLSRPDRMLCTVAALAVWPRLRQLRRYIAAALALGLSPEAVREVLVQAGLYAGFSAAEETLSLAAEVFAERGVAFPADPPADASLDELSRRGRELMQQVHGERSTQGYAAPDNAVTYALYELAIQYGYGEIWFRPGLPPRSRALVAVAAFTALRSSTHRASAWTTTSGRCKSPASAR